MQERLYVYVSATGWRRLIGSLKLRIIFHKRATRYRSLLRKMTYKDKGAYESSPPCTCADGRVTYILAFHVRTCICTHAHTIFLSLSLSCIYTYVHHLSQTHTYSLSVIHTNTHTQTLTHTNSHGEMSMRNGWAPVSMVSAAYTWIFYRALSLSHTFSHDFSFSVSYFLPPLLSSTLSISRVRARSLCLSLSPSLSL